MPNRTMCDVLDEMRVCHKTSNFSYLLSLIEEAQSMANRMEAALWDQRDYDAARKRARALSRVVKKVEDARDNLAGLYEDLAEIAEELVKNAEPNDEDPNEGGVPASYDCLSEDVESIKGTLHLIAQATGRRPLAWT